MIKPESKENNKVNRKNLGGKTHKFQSFQSNLNMYS